MPASGHPRSDLLSAIRSNAEPELIVEIIKAGVDVNEVVEKGKTAFAVYCEETRTGLKEEVIGAFLEHGAHFNVQDKEGRSPLHWILFRSLDDVHSLVKVVTLLLEMGANPLLQDLDGDSPFFMAIMRSLSELIIEAFFDLCPHLVEQLIHAQNNLGYNCLHLLAADPFFEKATFKLLLTRGASGNARDKKGNTPLHLIFIHKCADYLKRYKEVKYSPKVADGLAIESWRSKPSIYYVESKMMLKPIVDIFLENGFDVNQRNDAGETPLALAIRREVPLEAIQGLVPDHLTDDEYVALAIKHGKGGLEEFIRLLLEKGALLKPSAEDGLLLSVINNEYCSLPLLQLVLEKGCAPDVRSVRAALDKERLDFLLLVLKHASDTLKGQLRIELPNVLLLVTAIERTWVPMNEVPDTLALIVRQLVEQFNVDVNLLEEDSSLGFVLHNLIRNSDNIEALAAIDYLLTVEGFNLNQLLEVPVNNGSFVVTPLTYAFAVGKYSVAEKLILNLAEFKDLDLLQMQPKPGFAFAFQLLFEGGYDFEGLYEIGTNHGVPSQRFTHELNWFKAWKANKSKNVMSLTKLSAIAIRLDYGAETRRLTKEILLPEAVKSMLFLCNISTEYVPPPEEEEEGVDDFFDDFDEEYENSLDFASDYEVDDDDDYDDYDEDDHDFG